MAITYKFGSDPRQKVVFHSAGAGVKPTICIVHGGGYTSGSPGGVNPQPYLGAGFHVAALGYRLAPDHKWPKQVNDVRAGLLLTKTKTLQVDPAKTFILGWSAGGLMAVWMGVESLVRAMAGQSAEVSTVLSNPSGSLSKLFPRGYDRKLADPALHVGYSDGPFMLQHGTSDTVVPYAHAQAFKNACDVVSTRCDLVPFAGGHMGLSSAVQAKIHADIIAFFRSLT